jgi:hypothetical protein
LITLLRILRDLGLSITIWHIILSGSEKSSKRFSSSSIRLHIHLTQSIFV